MSSMTFARIASHIDTCGAHRKMEQAMSGWPSGTRDDIRFYRGSSAQYRYREHGSGKTIVFAVDPPVTLELYDELIDAYASNFRVIIFELPGMGFSVPGSGMDFSFFAFNNGVIEFLEAVAGKSAVLAFSCVMGLGGVDIASRRPDLVSHLVLMQTPSWDEKIRWKKSRDPKKILAKPFFGQIAMHFLKQKRAPKWLDLVVGNRVYFPEFCAKAEEALGSGAAWALASAFQLYLPDAGPRLGPLEQPFLCLWGMQDQSHLPTDKSSSLSFGANGALVQYEDLGHFPELEGVDRVCSDISHFVSTS